MHISDQPVPGNLVSTPQRSSINIETERAQMDVFLTSNLGFSLSLFFEVKILFVLTQLEILNLDVDFAIMFLTINQHLRHDQVTM